MHILVIDDDYVSGRILEDMLRRQYHTVTLMGDVDDIESLHGSLDEIHPEGVVLDIGILKELYILKKLPWPRNITCR
jgi:DNA-binding response OmpR family regulator